MPESTMQRESTRRHLCVAACENNPGAVYQCLDRDEASLDAAALIEAMNAAAASGALVGLGALLRIAAHRSPEALSHGARALLRSPSPEAQQAVLATCQSLLAADNAEGLAALLCAAEENGDDLEALSSPPPTQGLLQRAVAQQAHACVGTLLGHGFAADRANAAGVTPLGMARRSCDVEMTRLLSAHALACHLNPQTRLGLAQQRARSSNPAQV